MVGAPGDQGFNKAAGSATGAAYVFSFASSSGVTNFVNPTLEGIIGKGYSGGKNVNVSSLEAPDVFATSVSLNRTGDRLVVSSWNDKGFNNVAGGAVGAAYLFTFTDTNFSGAALTTTCLLYTSPSPRD